MVDMDKPWLKYRDKTGDLSTKLLEPGWAGALDEDELSYILAQLHQDVSLRLWWGMRPSWKRIPEEVVRRVAMDGDPDNQAHNRNLARPRKPSRAAA
jgi:hypothetical protein